MMMQEEADNRTDMQQQGDENDEEMEVREMKHADVKGRLELQLTLFYSSLEFFLK